MLEDVLEAIADIGSIASEILPLGLQHVEVETQLHQHDLMMMGRMRTYGERQPMPIYNREDFHTPASFGEPHGVAAALRAANVASMKLSRSSSVPSSRSVLIS